MKEILVWGNPEKEFERLGIQPKLTWQGYGWDKDEEMRVYEVNEDDFKILCDEKDNDEYWQDSGWRYCEGSNQGIPQSKAKVNGKELLCWYEPYVDEEDEEPYYEEFKHLLQYLCDSVGASQPRNVCALVADLAKYNNMTMAELFKIYQEDWELNDRVVSINIIDEGTQYALRCKRDCVIKCSKCGKERDLLQRDIKDNQVIPDSCECGGKNQFRYWLDHFIEE